MAIRPVSSIDENCVSSSRQQEGEPPAKIMRRTPEARAYRVVPVPFSQRRQPLSVLRTGTPFVAVEPPALQDRPLSGAITPPTSRNQMVSSPISPLTNPALFASPEDFLWMLYDYNTIYWCGYPLCKRPSGQVFMMAVLQSGDPALLLRVLAIPEATPHLFDILMTAFKASSNSPVSPRSGSLSLIMERLRTTNVPPLVIANLAKLAAVHHLESLVASLLDHPNACLFSPEHRGEILAAVVRAGFIVTAQRLIEQDQFATIPPAHIAAALSYAISNELPTVIDSLIHHPTFILLSTLQLGRILEAAIDLGDDQLTTGLLGHPNIGTIPATQVGVLAYKALHGRMKEAAAALVSHPNFKAITPDMLAKIILLGIGNMDILGNFSPLLSHPCAKNIPMNLWELALMGAVDHNNKDLIAMIMLVTKINTAAPQRMQRVVTHALKSNCNLELQILLLSFLDEADYPVAPEVATQALHTAINDGRDNLVVSIFSKLSASPQYRVYAEWLFNHFLEKGSFQLVHRILINTHGTNVINALLLNKALDLAVQNGHSELALSVLKALGGPDSLSQERLESLLLSALKKQMLPTILELLRCHAAENIGREQALEILDKAMSLVQLNAPAMVMGAMAHHENFRQLAADLLLDRDISQDQKMVMLLRSCAQGH